MSFPTLHQLISGYRQRNAASGPRLALSCWLLIYVSCRTALPIQAEEGPAVPARAGDGAGDGRKRLVQPALVFEPVGQDRHDVLDALVLSHQSCSCQGTTVGADAAQGDIAAVELLAQCLQSRHRLRLQAAIGQ